MTEYEHCGVPSLLVCSQIPVEYWPCKLKYLPKVFIVIKLVSHQGMSLYSQATWVVAKTDQTLCMWYTFMLCRSTSIYIYINVYAYIHNDGHKFIHQTRILPRHCNRA